MNEAKHRYVLEVAVADGGPTLTLIQKNPSLADATRSDATAGKVESWARANGFGRVVFANLFAYRTPYATTLNSVSYATAVGPLNDDHLVREAADADTVVAAWGNANGISPKRYQRRIGEVTESLAGVTLHHVGDLTALGYPRHGLMWNGNPQLRPWQP